MAEEQKINKVEAESPAPAPLAPVKDTASSPAEGSKDVTGEKFHSSTPAERPGDSKFKANEFIASKGSKEAPAPAPSSAGSIDRDVVLADLEKEKKLSFIKAWEESEKTKAINKAQKKLSDVIAWENSKKAAIEAQLRKTEEQLEKKKAEYAEKMKNKVAAIHKEAEEKRAMVEAKRGEEVLKAEEMAAKFRATGNVPKATFGCF